MHKFKEIKLILLERLLNQHLVWTEIIGAYFLHGSSLFENLIGKCKLFVAPTGFTHYKNLINVIGQNGVVKYYFHNQT